MTLAARSTEAATVIRLVRDAPDGDAEFASLYRDHAGRVYALCLRLAGDAERARELTQDVFVRAWERMDTFRGESALGSWLHRIAVNIALSAHRTDRRRVSRVEPRGELPDTPASGGAGAVRDLDLERAIAALPPGARTVFVLHDVEGYAHEEIARMMGIAVGTSKAHLFRARRQLRALLER